jgi:hypothetical protein
VLGDAPGLPDLMCYYLVWFLRGRWDGGATLLSEFPALEAWERRVQAIGHGVASEMSASEALEIARASEPSMPAQGDPQTARDPQGLEPGMTASVVPVTDSGDPAVSGTIRLVDRERIAILRDDPRVGSVCVHFPRVGYRVSRI